MSEEACNDANTQSVIEEIEALQAIMSPDELDVTYSPTGRPEKLQTTLYPATAEEENQHFVCLSLIIKFPPEYPDQKPPVIELKNPRGLADNFVDEALLKCYAKCDAFPGFQVVYEVIELLRECLTKSNKPTGQCTICLFDFDTADTYIFTNCYHHFHSHCLYRFCESLLKQWKEEEAQELSNNPAGANWREKKPNQFTCPVCREVISVDLNTLKLAPLPKGVENFEEKFKMDATYISQRKKMEEEYMKQKTRGGIIDIEAEDSRFLVVTEVTASALPESISPPTEDEVPQQKTLPTKETSSTKSYSDKTNWARGQTKPTQGKSSSSRRHEYVHHSRSGPVNNPPRPPNPHTSYQHASKNESRVRSAQHSQKESIVSSNGTSIPKEQAPLPPRCRPPPGFPPNS